MPIEPNPQTGRWWDTDQPVDLRDEYETEAEAAAAKRIREVALAAIPTDVWGQIGEYVGRTRAVGVGGRYAQDPRALANLSEVDWRRRAAVEQTRSTTRLIDTTALKSEVRRRKAELEEEFTQANVLAMAQNFAAQPGKRPKLPEGVERNQPLAKALYEYRGIKERVRLDREKEQRDGFLRQSAELGVDVVGLLQTGRLLNPATLPEHLTSAGKELDSTGQLGRLAEYLTIEEDIGAGRTVVAGPESPEAWSRFGATPDQIPSSTMRVGGDRTTFAVQSGGGLREVVTTQQKLVQHRSDVSRNITDAVNQLFGRSKPPEVPLLGSVLQIHIILPYPQAELPDVAGDVDGYRYKRQRLTSQTTGTAAMDTDSTPDDELEQKQADLEKAIESAQARPVDLDAWCLRTLADAASRKDFQLDPGSGSRWSLVMIVDLPTGRYRGTYRGDGSPPRVDREPAPAYLRRLLTIIERLASWDAAVAGERTYQISKLTRKRRGAVK